MVQVAHKIGRSATVAREYKSMLANVGFVVTVEIRKRILMDYGRIIHATRCQEIRAAICSIMVLKESQ